MHLAPLRCAPLELRRASALPADGHDLHHGERLLHERLLQRVVQHDLLTASTASLGESRDEARYAIAMGR